MTTAGHTKSGSTLAPKQATDAVEKAVEHLRAARDLLRSANAPKSLARVRLALSSAEGAVRNAGYRMSRAARISGA